MTKVETYQLAAATAVGVNSPKSIKRLDPEYGIAPDLDDLHPLLRPGTKNG